MAPVTVRDAATLILVRDAPPPSLQPAGPPGSAEGGLEVFLLRRNPNSAFVPSASVFPGGAVDLDDEHVPVAGRSDADCDRLLGRPNARRWWSAAAREAFEEAGILLSTPAPSHDLAAERDALNAGHRDFAAVLVEHGLAVDAGALHVVAHWLTPLGAPRRYDTWFFCAAAPDGQDGTHDDAELVHSEWVTPQAALQRHESGDIELIEPTLRTLLALTAFANAGDFLAAVRAVEAESSASHAAPFVVPESQGERIALLTHEQHSGHDARRGWRDLTVRVEGAA